MHAPEVQLVPASSAETTGSGCIQQLSRGSSSFTLEVRTSAAVITETADMYSAELACLEVGDRCVLQGLVVQINGQQATEIIIRAPVLFESMNGWTTIVEKYHNGHFQSNFHELVDGWGPICKGATNLNALWTEIDRMWDSVSELEKDLAAEQANVRKASQAQSSATKMDGIQVETLDALISCRNSCRSRLCQLLRDFLAENVQVLEQSFGWPGGARREGRAQKAQEQLSELEHGQELDVAGWAQDLKESRLRNTEARIEVRNAMTMLKNAGELDKPENELQSLQQSLREKQDQARIQQRAFSKCMAKLCQLADRHAPELLVHITELSNNCIKAEVHQLPHLELTEFLRVFDEQRSLIHYDDKLSDMKQLTSRRHDVYVTSIEGDRCVLKAFNMCGSRGLHSFIQEVLRHIKLRHPLVVPLQHAFLDWDLNRGFLHFEKYKSDLATQLQQPWQRQPHRLGDPVAAGLPDRIAAVRRIVNAMIQSVAHIHGIDVVHGDLNPSNWLWDDTVGLPCLCDFETAKDCAAGDGRGSKEVMASTTGPALQTRGYVAPELHDNPRCKTKASDVFALGRSIEEVLRSVGDYPDWRSPEQKQIENLAEEMTRNCPDDRISAQKAADAWWETSLMSDGETVVVPCKALNYSQRAIKQYFTDKRFLEDLIEEVVNDPSYPLKHERLVLDVVKKGEALLCMDNRRLYCFQEAQRRLGSGEVWVRVRQHHHSHVWDRYHDRDLQGGHGWSDRPRVRGNVWRERPAWKR